MTLVLQSVRSQAVTYRFRVESDLAQWAICTVNDQTGELLITSDWGNWSHRWNPRYLGSPSLTHFIGDRDSACYLAGKLIPGDCYQFSVEKSVREFQRMVCEARRSLDISREEARYFWDELSDLYGYNDTDGFLDAIARIDGFHKQIDDCPHESLQTEIKIILSPLIEACRARVANTHACEYCT